MSLWLKWAPCPPLWVGMLGKQRLLGMPAHSGAHATHFTYFVRASWHFEVNVEVARTKENRRFPPPAGPNGTFSADQISRSQMFRNCTGLPWYCN
jgi:hypothetical protein